MRWLARKLLRRIVAWAWAGKNRLCLEVLRFEDTPDDIFLRLTVRPMVFTVAYSVEDAFELAESLRSAAYAAIAEGD